MITKVTKDNRTAYIDLFDKANEIITSEREVDETLIYDLDTYFENFADLVLKDRSFLKLPLDEPYFEIVDGEKDGRRVINIPNDYKKNGISVQGDESAEIIWFSIDRYYDSTDLMGPSRNDIERGKSPLRIVIQWETKEAKGVSMALVDKDNRPFIDKNGKLYFGWPISSEITENAGNVKFNVRFYQFGGGTRTATDAEGNIIYDENGIAKEVPILAFSLNTQTATVKINSALNYEISGTTTYHDDDLALFEDADLILGKNEIVLNRIQNSTKFYDEGALVAANPEFIENIDVTDLQTITVGEGEEAETFYVKDLEGEEGTAFLDFQVFAKPSEGTGFITYYGQSKSQFGQAYSNIMSEPYISNTQADIYKRADSETRLEGVRYYVENEEMMIVPVASNDLPDVGEPWRTDELADGHSDYEEDGETLKYFVLKSPVFKMTSPGCFYIIATNNEGQKQIAQLDSNKIYIPHPTPLVNDNVVGGSSSVENPTPSFLLQDKINPSIIVSSTPGDTVIYQWNLKVNDDETNYHWEPCAGKTSAAYKSNEDLAVATPETFDEIYSVSCFTKRNNEPSESLTRYFRVTDAPHKFTFDMITKELYSNVDNVMPEITIDWSENTDGENGPLNFLCDSIKYQWFQVVAPEEDIIEGEVVTRQYDDDIRLFPAMDAEEEWAVAQNYSEVQSFTPPHEGAYYCKMVNVVNGSESEPCYTCYVKADDVKYL